MKKGILYLLLYDKRGVGKNLEAAIPESKLRFDQLVSEVNAFISIAGAGHSIDQVLYDQLKAQLSDELLAETKEIIGKIKQGKQVNDVSEQLQRVFRPSVQAYLTSWMHDDPATEIAKLEIPTLLLNGDNDLQVPVSEAKALHKANSDAKLLIIESMNHVLKEAPENRQGNMETYNNPDLPLATGLMDGIMNFLEAHEFVK